MGDCSIYFCSVSLWKAYGERMLSSVVWVVHHSASSPLKINLVVLEDLKKEDVEKFVRFC